MRWFAHPYLLNHCQSHFFLDQLKANPCHPLACQIPRVLPNSPDVYLLTIRSLSQKMFTQFIGAMTGYSTGYDMWYVNLELNQNHNLWNTHFWIDMWIWFWWNDIIWDDCFDTSTMYQFQYWPRYPTISFINIIFFYTVQYTVYSISTH